MISDNFLAIKEKIANAAKKTGRKPEEIKLVAITKNVPPDKIIEVVRHGITDIGENKIQEAVKKYAEISEYPGLKTPIMWHMVGHLQTNKVKKALQIFNLLQSLDSIRLAEEINNHAKNLNKTQDCLIEIKVSEEPSKTGLILGELNQFLEKTQGLKNIRLKGLMAMPPLFDSPEKARPYFKKAAELYEKLKRQIPGFDCLSMGMSADFEVAIEEGANMVRIGTALFC